MHCILKCGLLLAIIFHSTQSTQSGAQRWDVTEKSKTGYKWAKRKNNQKPCRSQLCCESYPGWGSHKQICERNDEKLLPQSLTFGFHMWKEQGHPTLQEATDLQSAPWHPLKMEHTYTLPWPWNCQKTCKTPKWLVFLFPQSANCCLLVFALRNTSAKPLKNFRNVKRPAACCSSSCFGCNLLLGTPLSCLAFPKHFINYYNFDCWIIQGS